MSKIENKRFWGTEKDLYVATLRLKIDPFGNPVVNQELVEADPYDYRKFRDLQEKRPPSCEPPQELAQNE